MTKSKAKAPKRRVVLPERWQPKELNRAKSLLDKGLTVAAAAAKLNRTKGALQTAISRHGLRD